MIETLTAIAKTIRDTGINYNYTVEQNFNDMLREFGATYVGNGCDRVAVLIEDRLFKFSMHRNSYQNASEWDNYNKIVRDMADNPEKYLGWAIPTMQAWFTEAGIVIETEMILGEPTNDWDYSNPFGVTDPHTGNLRLVGDTVYVLDLGLTFAG